MIALEFDVRKVAQSRKYSNKLLFLKVWNIFSTSQLCLISSHKHRV